MQDISCIPSTHLQTCHEQRHWNTDSHSITAATQHHEQRSRRCPGRVQDHPSCAHSHRPSPAPLDDLFTSQDTTNNKDICKDGRSLTKIFQRLTNIRNFPRANISRTIQNCTSLHDIIKNLINKSMPQGMWLDGRAVRVTDLQSTRCSSKSKSSRCNLSK